MTDPNIAHAAWQVGHSAEVLAQEIASYHASWFSVLKPKLTKDGNMWCALHGEDLQDGIAGFGPTPAKALLAFEAAMCSESGSHVIVRALTLNLKPEDQIVQIIKSNLSAPMFDDAQILESHDQDICNTAREILRALEGSQP